MSLFFWSAVTASLISSKLPEDHVISIIRAIDRVIGLNDIPNNCEFKEKLTLKWANMIHFTRQHGVAKANDAKNDESIIFFIRLSY